MTRKSPPVLVKLRVGEAKLISGRALNRIDSLAGVGGFRGVPLAGPRARGEKDTHARSNLPQGGLGEAGDFAALNPTTAIFRSVESTLQRSSNRLT